MRTWVAVSPAVSAGRSRSRRGLVALQSTNSSMPPLYFQLSSTLRMTRIPYLLACRMYKQDMDPSTCQGLPAEAMMSHMPPSHRLAPVATAPTAVAVRTCPIPHPRQLVLKTVQRVYAMRPLKAGSHGMCCLQRTPGRQDASFRHCVIFTRPGRS